jgi:hypothetical protein
MLPAVAADISHTLPKNRFVSCPIQQRSIFVRRRPH